MHRARFERYLVCSVEINCIYKLIIYIFFLFNKKRKKKKRKEKKIVQIVIFVGLMYFIYCDIIKMMLKLLKVKD